MPQDQKIGLALGILLVGAVAAFFFRHESPKEQPLPVLKTAAELDRQIATRDRTPYLPADEPAPKAAAEQAPVESPIPDPQDGAGLVPEPIAGADEPALDPVTPTTSAAATPPATHVVERGETLSSIAAKYLGSAARFEDIYQANTDRLRNPNDVRPGMTLKIPAGQTLAATPRNDSATTPAAAGSSTTATASSANRKFQPYGRSPLKPQQGDGEPTQPTPGRRLSVTPPRDGAVIR